MTTATISVPAAELRRCLAAVLPHASRDYTLPRICGVQLQVSAGVLYLAATDRYTLGVARIAIPGAAGVPVPDQSALLPPRAAEGLLRLLRDADGVAALAVGGTRLSADAGDGTTGSWGIGEQHGEFTDWRPLLHRMLTAEQVPLGDGYGVDPALLGRFADRCRDPVAEDTLSIRVTRGATRQNGSRPDESPSPIVLVTRGTWLAGALMPVRLRTGSGKAWADWTALLAPAAGPAEAAGTPEPELAAVSGA